MSLASQERPAMIDFVVPELDVLTYVLGASPVADDFVQYIDADNEERQLSRAQVITMVKRIAHSLRRLGLATGDVVLGFSPNSILYPCMIYSTICAGGIFTGANPAYTARELEYQMTHSGAKFVIVDPANLKSVLEVLKSTGMKRESVITTEPVEGFHSLRSLAASEAELEWQRITDPKQLRDTTCVILYSSGTTGLPKGVELSHANVVANTAQVQWFADEGDAAFQREGLPSITGMMIGHLPMYHAYGFTQICNLGMRTGTCFIITRKFNLAQMLSIIERHKIAILATVPPIITLFAKDPMVSKYDLSSLRAVKSGAAPLGKAVQEALRSRIGQQCRFQQGYGMSESTCMATSFRPSDHDSTGAVGYLAPGTSAKLIDEHGVLVQQPGERGELCIRGPQVMKGYFNDPTATNRTIIDGWLHTGDIARCENNLYYIVDRKKELIKYKGMQVAPAELEALLLSHESITDVAVVGVPFHGDEAPRAYIVLAIHGQTLTEQEIWTWMESRVARYKLLRGGVAFVKSLPKSPSGKLLRRLLRDQAKQELGHTNDENVQCVAQPTEKRLAGSKELTTSRKTVLDASSTMPPHMRRPLSIVNRSVTCVNT